MDDGICVLSCAAPGSIGLDSTATNGHSAIQYALKIDRTHSNWKWFVGIDTVQVEFSARLLDFFR
jgi:hypothetical protein